MLTHCPVCDGRVLTVFDKVDVGPRGVATIYICRTCLALLNGAAYDALEAGHIADLQKTDFYAVNADEPATSHLDKIANYQQILEHFFQCESRPLADLTFLDFGCGRGYAALAAAARCRRVVACDYDLAAYQSVAMSLRDAGSAPDNIIAIDDIASATERSDIVFMWHVLEHLPYPSAFWRECQPHLQPDAAFIVQSPMFRPEYVIDAHFVFFTEPSLRRWAEEIGATSVEFRYDVPRAFIAVHARTADSTSAQRF
jgi:2-polyprenyl-3-methyl-5-hydroxy-6-metoxy-1,4-benzoquinol methylase